MKISKLFGLIALSSLVCFGCGGSGDNDYDCVLDVECEGTQVCRNGKCVSPESLCGNDVLDTGETCDGDCPDSCDDGDDCTSDVLSGSAEECSVDCIYTPITNCADGDGCCPANCATANDNDCADDGFALRLNAGLETGTSTFDGKVFEPLRQYLTAGGANSSADLGLGIPINGTVFDELYQVEFYIPVAGSPATFSIPLEEGDYTVHLHFVDWTPYTSVVGDRVFHVDIQDERVLTDFDMIAEAGKDTAIVKSFDVSVTTGSVEVTITNSVFVAEIAAIEILRPGQPFLGEGGEEPACGDGIVADGLEACDDGNTLDGDGCSHFCVVESGWVCDGEPSACEENIPTCGDGLVAPGQEGCDDGNTASDDGCSESCQVESGWSCIGEPSICSEIPSSGIIQNTVDIVWDDVHGTNTEWCCQTASQPQLWGALIHDFNNIDTIKGVPIFSVNQWYEIEEEGDGSVCSPSIHQAVHTRVEVGKQRAYHLFYNTVTGQYRWNQFGDINTDAGTRMPNPSDPYGATNFRRCGEIYDPLRRPYFDYQPKLSHSGNLVTNSDTGYFMYKPENYWVWHGWGLARPSFASLLQPNEVKKAVFIQTYMRLVVDTADNPDNIDDRNLARYVAHIGSDVKDPAGKTCCGAVGISRHKKVTNDWQPFNLITGGITKQELIDSNIPITSIP